MKDTLIVTNLVYTRVLFVPIGTIAARLVRQPSIPIVKSIFKAAALGTTIIIVIIAEDTATPA